MWKVIVDYENYHRIDDEDGNTIAHIQPNYNVELELENEDSGDPNLEAIKTIAEKHNQRIAELEEVLWFYGDEHNYQGFFDPDYQWTGESKSYPSDIEEDEGRKAREVLQKELSDE